MSYIYLASPYSHDKPEVRESRYLAVMEVTAYYLRQGESIYSPIVHCHEMAIRYSLPKEFDFWQSYNKAMISGSYCVTVLMIDGWRSSIGVQAEIEIAKKLNKNLNFIEYIEGIYSHD